jgi:hypothetical protein
MSTHTATMITITHTAMTNMTMNIIMSTAMEITAMDTTITIMAGIWLTSRLSCAQAI